MTIQWILSDLDHPAVLIPTNHWKQTTPSAMMNDNRKFEIFAPILITNDIHVKSYD